MKCACPLCKQPVSASLYQKITGIWEARREALARIRAQKARLLLRFKEKERKLRDQSCRFRKQKARLIRQAVTNRTRPLRNQIRALRLEEMKIKKAADEKVQKAVMVARRRADKHWAHQLGSLRRELHASMREQVEKERSSTTERVERRYRKLSNSFQFALQQMEIKDSRLREQADQIKELQRELRRETTPQIEGLLYEERLLKELRKRFPEDKFKHEGKGGDVLHWPIRNRHVAGLIVYECKRVRRYLPSYVEQAADSKEKRKADFAILVTNAMKKRTHGFFAERGVLVVHPSGVIHLASVLRGQTVRIAEMKLGQQQRNKAVKLTLEYLEGPEFANSMEGIMHQALTLYEDLKREVRNHVTEWRKRGAAYEKIYADASTVKSTTRAMLSGEPEYQTLVQTENLPPILELPELEKSIATSESEEIADIKKQAARQSSSTGTAEIPETLEGEKSA
jgi:hypothetical protein